jgi:phospholipid/cholesterol/gamma-HCH transport system ATP-binding protein
MIVVSHDIHSTMRMADHILLLLDGRAIEGTPEQLRQNQDPAAREFFNDASEAALPQRNA